MTEPAIMRDFICKLHASERYMLTAFRLLFGSLVTHDWIRVQDKYVSNTGNKVPDSVLKLYSENFAMANTQRFTLYWLFFKGTAYVYKDKDTIKGYCLYYVIPSLSSRGLRKTATLHTFAVDERYKRKGVGYRLLQKSILEMRINNVHKVMLYVASDNEAAVNLYKKGGFRIRGEVMDICDPGKECYEMELVLDENSLREHDPGDSFHMPYSTPDEEEAQVFTGPGPVLAHLC